MANQNFSYNSVPKIKKRLKLMIKTRKWEIKLISRKKKRSKILKMLLKFIELQKKKATKEEINISQIEEVSEDNSILQTPIKEQSLSFTD